MTQIPSSTHRSLSAPAPAVPTRAEAERTGELPHPRRERWQPLRVGLLDLFHYDYQEFWFRDGRLLWRGNNGTGKSKVLALTLPFLLDGEAAAHRVEPDGDQHKRMEWNLLLGGRYPERLGYTWIEFGRLDADGSEHFLTAGIAMKAVAGRGIADRWFFVTDRRIGPELSLVTATGTALTRDRLTEAIGDRGQVVRTAEHYRRLLDERLFQLGTDRYGALVDLLIQLRQPQLSKRPDAVVLSRALSEALTPLDAGLLVDAAAGFHDLEQQRDELRSLKDAHAHLQRFGVRYTRYASVAARRQARELRATHSHYEDAGRRLGEVRQLAEAAEAAKDRTASRLKEVRHRYRELEAVREQLTEAPELRQLDRARTETESARRRAEAAAGRLTAARDTRERSAARLVSAENAAAAAASHRDEAVHATATAADEAASGTAHAHAVALPGVLADPAPLRRALAAVADERTAALDRVRQLIRESSAAATRRTERLARLAGLEADRDAAADALTEARTAVVTEGERLVGAWMGFAARTDVVAVPYPDEAGLPDWVVALDGPDPASLVLDERVQDVRRDLARTEAAARARLVDVRARISELAARRAELEAGIPQCPPVPPTRDDTARIGRPGAPLWRVVDVRDDPAGPQLTGTERAGLEAALEASGLLDAWVTPDGEVLDPDRLDTVLLPAGAQVGGRSLADLLHATIDPDDGQAAALGVEAVTGVLRAVEVRPSVAELGEDERDAAVVCLDGSYRLGPLHGRWTKPAAEYVGAAAREQARRARLAELEATLDTAEFERAETEAALDQVAAVEARLVTQLQERPTDQSLRDAHARAAAAGTDLERREAALRPAREAVESARAEAEAAQQVLGETAADLGLPAEVTEAERVAAALARYRALGSELVAAVQRHADRLVDVGAWQAELEAAAESLSAAADEEAAADDERRAAEARLRTLAETVGDTVEELRTQLDRTVAELGTLTGEERDLDARHTEAALQLGQALGRQEELLIEQRSRQQVRDDAATALRAFAATGLLAVAVPDLDVPDPTTEWAADPAVRLARRVEAALTEVDDSDTAWKRVQDDITRRFAELAESLTRHGHQAHADLREGRYVVSIVYTGRERSPAELIALLEAETELRERELTTREQQVLEEHLVGDVASRLQELITEADALVGWMNAELAERPTSTGMRLRLVWQPDPEGPEGLAEARAHLLRQTSQLWSEADRHAVRDFLQRQIQRMRAADPQGTWAEHLRLALDYRSWHRFVIERLQDGVWRSAIGPASGGERVLTVSLPLFAAASAHYRSAHPHAPRLVLLDEAFAGVDDDARAKCLGLLTQFDLDVAMTSEREWGFYATVPGIATYQLVRHDGVDAVHVTAWEWDGALPQQVSRPIVLPQAPGPATTPPPGSGSGSGTGAGGAGSGGAGSGGAGSGGAGEGGAGEGGAGSGGAGEGEALF
jgi:uncharacterized protein (TIGR02680 family)